MSTLSLADAQQLVGTDVRVLGPWAPAVRGVPEGGVPDGELPPANPTELAEPLTLAVLRVDDRDVPGPYDQFSLVLEGPAAVPLAQGTYELDHDERDLGPLLLVPIAERDGIRRYEAVLTARRQGVRT